MSARNSKKVGRRKSAANSNILKEKNDPERTVYRHVAQSAIYNVS